MLFFVLFLSPFLIKSQTLCIEISNIQNNKGKLILAFFSNNDDFKKENSLFDKIYSKSDVENGEMIVKINIDSGTYGITVLDDENDDGKMKYNFIRLPIEGYGFSNFIHNALWTPKFEEFNFIMGQEDITVKIKMRYL